MPSISQPLADPDQWITVAELAIVVGPNADPLVDQAAQELQRYMSRLFGRHFPLCKTDQLPPKPACIVVGGPAHTPAARHFPGVDWQPLPTEAHLLRTIQDANGVRLLLAGGSGLATAYAVYALMETYGVRYGLWEDYFPQKSGPLRLPRLNLRLDPALTIRGWHGHNNLPEGPGGWRLQDYLTHLAQIRKLRANTFAFSLRSWQPWTTYQFRGLRNSNGDLFYGCKFPIDDTYIGRELIPDRDQYYPEELRAEDGPQRHERGTHFVKALIQEARRLGLKVVLSTGLMDIPEPFKHAFKEWATVSPPKVQKKEFLLRLPTGEEGFNPNLSEWHNIADPVVYEFAKVRLRQTAQTYPDADYYSFGQAEFISSTGSFERALATLNQRYDFAKALCFQEIYQHGGRYQHPDRIVRSVQATVEYLELFDRLFFKDNVLADTPNPNAKPILGLHFFGLELLPGIVRMLGDRAVLMPTIDYGVHACACKLDMLAPLAGTGTEVWLEMVLDEDNNMRLPQHTTRSLQKIMREGPAVGVNGFLAGHWRIRVNEPSAAYAMRAAWDPEVSIGDFDRFYFGQLCGTRAARTLRRAFNILEEADAHNREKLIGFGFTFPASFENCLAPPTKVNGDDIPMGREQSEDDGLSPDLRITLEAFEKVLVLLRRAFAEAKGRQEYIDYWIMQLEFGIAYILLKHAGRRLAPVAHGARQDRTLMPKAKAAYQELVTQTQQTIQILTRHVLGRDDQGMLAALNEWVLRPVLEFADFRLKEQPYSLGVRH